MKQLLVPIALTLLVACGREPAPEIQGAPATTAAREADGARRIEADVAFLADDLLEGRAAGTRGYDLAALYVANRYRAIGLEPAGDDGSYLQAVPLLEGRRESEGASFSISRGGERIEFTFQDDFLPGVNYNAASHAVTAPLVFVGQAVHAPELDHDDFEGVDVRGKIAAVQIGNPVDEAKYPWARGARNWAMPGMRLLGPDGQPVDAFPELRATASLGVHAARRLFEGAPMDADEVLARREAGTLEAFDLEGQATLAGRTTLAKVTSHNVVGRLAGTDAALASEHIVYTAHLDHVGIGAEVDGDGIYNGAFDNALGTAVMLEAATELVATPAPKRTLLFVALTAEERGLLGAEHFASNPGVEGTLVANINMDMPVFLADVTDVVPIGIEHSSLENDVKAAADVLGIGLTADPKPEEVVFVRSDQYAFVRKGIPAVYLDAGIKARSPDVDALALYEDFLTGHYHQPSDETALPIHYPSAARLAMLNAAIGRRVGDADQKPRWKEGDFFGRTFGGQ